MSISYSNLIRLTKIRELGELGDLLTLSDGNPVKTPADWQKKRGELYRTVIEIQYGIQPPAPEVFEVEPLAFSEFTNVYRITAGPAACPVSFRMILFFVPGADSLCPVVIDGDACWQYPYNRDFIQAFRGRGIAFALFDRTEIVPDIRDAGRNGRLSASSSVWRSVRRWRGTS